MLFIFSNTRRLLLCFILLMPLWLTAQAILPNSQLTSVFDSAKVNGAFFLLDPSLNVIHSSDPDLLNNQFLPASTFKVCNSLIALQTGAVPDIHTVIPWDSVPHDVEAWNHDHTMATAFPNSVVWFYQSLARTMGKKTLRHWMMAARYGNHRTGGKVDRFWLDGALRISPRQQMDFLNRLYLKELPFDISVQDTVLSLMQVPVNAAYSLRAKTGWAIRKKDQIGWYVGIVETEEGYFPFATVLQAPLNSPGFGPMRRELTNQCLYNLGFR
jgi:beta-lactamase class D